MEQIVKFLEKHWKLELGVVMIVGLGILLIRYVLVIVVLGFVLAVIALDKRRSSRKTIITTTTIKKEIKKMRWDDLLYSLLFIPFYLVFIPIDQGMGFGWDIPIFWQLIRYLIQKKRRSIDVKRNNMA